MSKAIIMSSELNEFGDDISLMTMLAVASIRMFGGEHKKIPIYCAVFTSKKLPLKTRKYLKLMNVELQQISEYRDITKNMEGNEAIYGRHLCCYHYGKELLHKYDQLMYVDVDALCLNPIKFTDKKGIIIDTIPPSFLATDFQEGQYAKIEAAMLDEGCKIVDGKYYSMWISQINKDNFFLWESWFQLFKDLELFRENNFSRAESILMNQLIHHSGIEVIDPIEIGASIPTVDDGFDASHTWCHYDTFDESGYVWDLVNKIDPKKTGNILFWLRAFHARLPRSFIYQIAKMKSRELQKQFYKMLQGKTE